MTAADLPAASKIEPPLELMMKTPHLVMITKTLDLTSATATEVIWTTSAVDDGGHATPGHHPPRDPYDLWLVEIFEGESYCF